MSSNCLTNQNRVDYYCSLRTSKDAYTLQELLPTSQENAESVHLLIHHPRSLCDRPALLELLQVIGQLPHLREFSISILLQARKFPASALALFLRHAKNLQVLHLEDISLQGSPYELAEVLKAHKTLHTVHMVRCYCSPVHVLLQALAKMPQLHTLSLDGSILAQQQDADALAALGAICGKSKSLKRLHLDEIEESTMTQPLIIMMDALQESSTISLSELSLQVAVRETLPLSVVRAMARMLRTNMSLRTITVPWTGGGEVYLPLIEALAVNRTLQAFRLHPHTNVARSNSKCLSQHFLQRAAVTLRDHNTQLSYFWYDSWEGIDLEIDLYIKSNRLGRGHLLFDRHKPTHDEWVRTLVASADHVHVTNYWLSQNPALLVEAVAKSS